MTFRTERGSITAEFAVVLPAVLLVLVLCVGAASVSVQRVEAQSAASAAARILARGDGEGAAAGAVGRLAPGARMDSARDGDFVCVSVTSTARFVAARSAGVRLTGRACALSGSESP
jgi:Flp pilus assembly protein TadG